MNAAGRLFYDADAKRLGPFLRGHLLLFDKRAVVAYSAASGWVLVALFVTFELLLGPRLSVLGWAGIAPANPALRLSLQIFAVLAGVRLIAKLRLRDVGFLPLTQWTSTETFYFMQVVTAASAILYLLFLRRVSPAAGPLGAAGLIILAQILWGFYQELMYRGLLQTELTRRFGAIWGVLMSNAAFTFGPLHFYYFHSNMTDVGKAAMFALIFAIGLFFAFIFARTANLWIVGIFHGIGNLFANGGTELHSLLR